MSWKDKIDAKERACLDEEELVRLKAKRLRDEQTAASIRAIQEEENARKINLAKFQCHICGTPAQKPGIGIIPGRSGLDADDRWPDTEVPDWNVPGDLFKCTICHEWTCEEHIYKGICQRCAEKLPD